MSMSNETIHDDTDSTLANHKKEEAVRGSVPFFFQRDVENILKSVKAGTTCIVVGSVKRGKSKLLRCVYDEIKHAPEFEAYDVLYHRLTDMNISAPGYFFRDLARDINTNLTRVRWRDVADQLDYTHLLKHVVNESHRNIVYIIDNMQTLPSNLITDLLGAIYGVLNDRDQTLGARLIVVLCSTIDIQLTARREIHSFERANPTRIILEDLTPEEAAALVAIHCEKANLTLKPECLDTLFTQTGYDYYLIEQVITKCSAILAAQARDEVDEALILEAIDSFVEDFSPDDVLARYFKRSKDVLMTAVNLIEPKHTQNGGSTISSTDYYYLEMLRALFKKEENTHEIYVKCPLWDRLLRTHLTPLQIGRYFVLHREWEQALRYLGRAYAEGDCSADELKSTILTAMYASKTPDVHKFKDDEQPIRPQQGIDYLLLGLEQLYPNSSPTLYINGVKEVHTVHRRSEARIEQALYENAIGEQEYSVIRLTPHSSRNLILLPITVGGGKPATRGLVTLYQPIKIYGNVYTVWEHNQELLSFLDEAAAALVIKQQKIDSMANTARFMTKVNALFDVREFLHHNDLNEDLLLQLACHVISAGVGLGFNRVVFLMRSEQENQLLVKRAIGHKTYAEARPDWDMVKGQFESLKALCAHVIKGGGKNWSPKSLEEALIGKRLYITPNAYRTAGRIEQRVIKAFNSGKKQHDQVGPPRGGKYNAREVSDQHRYTQTHKGILSSALLQQQTPPGSEYLVMPLKDSGGAVMGVVYVDSMFSGHRITPQLTTLLETFLRQLALAIENHRSYEQRKRETESLRRLLIATQETTSSTTNVQDLAQKVVQHAAELLGADSAVVYSVRSRRASSLPEDQGFVKAYPPHIDVESVDNLNRTGKIRSIVRRVGELIIESLDDDQGNAGPEEYTDIRESKFIREQKIKCFVGTRLGEGDEDLGVLYVNWKSPDQLNPEKLNLLRVYKEVATQALKNAQITQRYMDRADAVRDVLVTATLSTEEESEKLEKLVFEDLSAVHREMRPKPAALRLYLAEANGQCANFSIDGHGSTSVIRMPHADIPAVALDAFRQREMCSDSGDTCCGAVAYPLEVGGNTVAVLYVEHAPAPQNVSPQPEFLKDFSATQYHISRLDMINFYQAQREILDLISEEHQVESEDQISKMLESLTSIMMRSSRTVDAISLYYMDRGRSNLKLGALQEFKDSDHHLANWEQDEELLRGVLNSDQPLLTHEDERYLLDNAVAAHEGFKACVLVPLRIDKRPVGCIFFNYRYPHEFNDAEKQQMRVLGEFAATAIYQMMLLRMFNDLSDFARSINENLEPEEVLKKLLTQVRDVTRADNVAIVELRADGQLSIAPLNLHPKGHDRPFYSTDRPLTAEEPYIVPGGASPNAEPETLAGWVIKNRTPVYLPDVDAPHSYPYHRANVRTRSELVVPIIRDKKCSAAIVLESDTLDAFTDEDQKWVTRLAEHAGIAMQNAEMQVQVVLNMLHNMRIAVSTAYANVTAAHERYQQGENILENLKNVWHYLDDMNDILSALTARRTNTRAFHEVTYIKHLMRGLGKKADIRSIHSIYFNDRDTYKQQIRCDEVLLTHALWNVILNGHESTEEKYGTSSTQAAVRVKSYIKGGYLCVLITDNGTGIKKVDGSFNYIFESGYTTKGSKRLFAGEGLSTFTKIVHNHHGRHQVYSREGWGTCFKIMLPLVGSPEIAR